MTSVGYKLYREVRDYAPQDWSSGMLVVALMIADDARDETRRSKIAEPELCRRARLAPSSVRAALARLGGGGFEFRVPHGTGADGRPVYAMKGHRVEYLVPDIAKAASEQAPLNPPGLPAIPVDNPPEGASERAPLALVPDSKGARKTGNGASGRAPISAKGARKPAPSFPNYIHPPEKPPSTEEPPVSDSNLEDAQLSTGEPSGSNGNGSGRPAATRRPSPIEIAAWQATQHRAGRPRQATHGEQP